MLDMQCFYCSYPKSKVVAETKDLVRNEIKRCRECVKCKARFNTRDAIKPVISHTKPPTHVLKS